VARHLTAHAIDADAAWLRAIYVDPHGRMLATMSVSRFHPKGLAALLRAREQGICGTTWCDAPVRHLDHITPHAEGGATSLDNGQGLCARCNHAKQSPGWTQKATDVDGRHAVQTTTPTGHTMVAVAPEPPRPVHETAPALTPAVAARPPEPVGETVRDGSGQPAAARKPPWTPAVGMSGPRPGRIPRSRYSIGCHTGPDRAAIAYRPSGRRGPARHRHRRRSRPDLAWAHTP
jgi:hypothetical protein